MRKITPIILLLLFVLFLTSCGKTQTREISCEEIIAAYKQAGYYVTHGVHQDEADGSQLCYIRADLSEESNSDYIYFINCFTEEQAADAAETDKYNLFIWFYATLCGEPRWLKTGTYGKIEYSYYNPELFEPFYELITE